MNTNFLPAASPASAKYWCELKDLSNSVKLELITLLSSSMSYSESESNEDEGWTRSFAGKWQDDRSAEDIISDIRSERKSLVRTFNL